MRKPSNETTCSRRHRRGQGGTIVNKTHKVNGGFNNVKTVINQTCMKSFLTKENIIDLGIAELLRI